jgi:hypothetical protein
MPWMYAVGTVDSASSRPPAMLQRFSTVVVSDRPVMTILTVCIVTIMSAAER